MTCLFAISARGHVADLLRYVFEQEEAYNATQWQEIPTIAS